VRDFFTRSERVYRNRELKKKNPRTMSVCFVATLIFSVAAVIAVHRQRQRRKCTNATNDCCASTPSRYTATRCWCFVAARPTQAAAPCCTLGCKPVV
jgi:hypothetical protein